MTDWGSQPPPFRTDRYNTDEYRPDAAGTGCAVLCLVLAVVAVWFVIVLCAVLWGA